MSFEYELQRMNEIARQTEEKLSIFFGRIDPERRFQRETEESLLETMRGFEEWAEQQEEKKRLERLPAYIDRVHNACHDIWDNYEQFVKDNKRFEYWMLQRSFVLAIGSEFHRDYTARYATSVLNGGLYTEDLHENMLMIRGVALLFDGKSEGADDIEEANRLWRERIERPKSEVPPYPQIDEFYATKLRIANDLAKADPIHNNMNQAMAMLYRSSGWEEADCILARMREQVTHYGQLAEAAFVEAIFCMWAGLIEDAHKAAKEHQRLCNCYEGERTLKCLLEVFDELNLPPIERLG